jgi:hypothetical protein
MGLLQVGYLDGEGEHGIRDWHKWKAWYPVIAEGEITWGKVIERRYVIHGLSRLTWPIYEYRQVGSKKGEPEKQPETKENEQVRYKLDKKLKHRRKRNG